MVRAPWRVVLVQQENIREYDTGGPSLGQVAVSHVGQVPVPSGPRSGLASQQLYNWGFTVVLFDGDQPSPRQMLQGDGFHLPANTV